MKCRIRDNEIVYRGLLVLVVEKNNQFSSSKDCFVLESSWTVLATVGDRKRSGRHGVS